MTGWNGPRIGRRSLVAGAAAGALFAPAIVRAQGSSATCRSGASRGRRQLADHPEDVDDGLFEAAAKELGVDLTVDWRDYPSALPQVEAFLAGDLDIGMWGNTPIVRLLAQAQPLNLLTVGEGHLRFVVAVRRLGDHQARRPQGQDCRGAGRGRPVQRLLADAPARARQRRSEPSTSPSSTPRPRRRRRRSHGHGRRDRDLSGLPQGSGGDRGERDHELLRLHRGRLQRPGRGRGGARATGGEAVGLLPGRLLPAPLVLDLH